MASSGPRYFGFVIGGTLPVALASDWLVSAWDQNPGLYATSPAVAVIEETVAAWLLDLFGLPPGSGVGFVTDGQMANFTCLAAARHEVLRRTGWDVEEEGLTGAPRVRLIVSEEAHFTILSSFRLLGFGAGTVRRVPADEQGRMRAEAVAAPSLRKLTEGISRADTWTVDAHKWLNVPYDCGVAIVRHAAAHRAAMTIGAAYLMTRGAALARRMAERLRAVPGVAVLNDVVLNQVLVRFGDSDERTRSVVSGVQKEGTCWLSGTTWRGKAAMRISVVGASTTGEDADRSVDAILRVARATG